MMRDNTKIGRRSKQKGSSYERFVAEQFRPIWPRATRGIGQSRAAGEVPDVRGTPLWIECKHRKYLNLFEAFKQAQAGLAEYITLGGDANDFRFPIVVARLDSATAFEKRSDLVVLSLQDFLNIVGGLSQLRASKPSEIA